MKLESWLQSNPLEKKESEIIDFEFPQGEAAHEAYLRKYNDEIDRAAKIKEVLYEFISEEIKNIKIFKSRDGKVELPYTLIKVGDLARKIYEKISGKPAVESVDNQEMIMRKEFVFGTSVVTAEGDHFTFLEEAMSQCVKYLPAMLEKLDKGEALDEDREIITLGMPTNVLGKLSKEFVENAKKSPYEEIGKVYAEAMEDHLREEQNVKSIELYAASMGSNFAIRAAEDLVRRDKVTQDVDRAKNDHKTFMQIRVEAPVSLSKSWIKTLQISAGFIIDSIYESGLPEIKRIESGKTKFAQDVSGVLYERGIIEQMSSDQKTLKNKLLFNIIAKLGDKFELNLETKLNVVFGLGDMTTYTPGFAKEAKGKREEFKGSIGQNIHKRQRKNIRVFSAEMPHLSPRFPDSELRRMRALGICIEEIEKRSK